ncbi:hypothetical protein QQF64_019607 [Cirrhinus molitorella]|uniref:Uncharacterized protein n=1 Tax=Cirrhinus molitorella TaxID=172907 RepID=A0ABR3LFY5_9TELE
MQETSPTHFIKTALLTAAVTSAAHYASRTKLIFPFLLSFDSVMVESSMIVPYGFRQLPLLKERPSFMPFLIDTEQQHLRGSRGYDCSRALAPRQVITGGDEEPYAVRTDLGWSIVGSSPRIAKSTEVTGLCHRVSVKEIQYLHRRCSEPLNQFQDITRSKERSISQEDIQFTQLLNEKIHQTQRDTLRALPFLDTAHQLPENKQLAPCATEGVLTGRFEKDPNSKMKYVKFNEGVFRMAMRRD